MLNVFKNLYLKTSVTIFSFSGLDMDHICLRTDGLSARYRSMDILPDYGCMILSPANLWARDSESFQMDPNLIATVFNYQRSREGNSSDKVSIYLF